MAAEHSRRQQLEAARARALRHLHALRRAVLDGQRYDPAAFDQAVLAYRLAGAAPEADEQGPPARVPEPQGPPLVVTPRLRYGRYLYEHGLISDWPSGEQG